MTPAQASFEYYMNKMKTGQYIEVDRFFFEKAYPSDSLYYSTSIEKFFSSTVGAAWGIWEVRFDPFTNTYRISKHPECNKQVYTDPDRRQTNEIFNFPMDDWENFRPSRALKRVIRVIKETPELPSFNSKESFPCSSIYEQTIEEVTVLDKYECPSCSDYIRETEPDKYGNQVWKCLKCGIRFRSLNEMKFKEN